MGCRISKEEDPNVTPAGQGDIDDALRGIDRCPYTVLMFGMSAPSLLPATQLQQGTPHGPDTYT